MNNKHFELTEEKVITVDGHVLYRILALRDIPGHSVKKGDLGGFVESYDNLSDNAWVYGDAKVYEDARVYGNAAVFENARVFGDTEVYGNARVFGNAYVYGNAAVIENARVYGCALVGDNACVGEFAKVHGDAHISGDAEVKSNEDYIVFKNFWSSGRYFTWTRSNNMWRSGCFYGTGEELIKKAYEDSEESGKHYKRVVDYVNEILKEEECK
jgi:hypothetical protein